MTAVAGEVLPGFAARGQPGAPERVFQPAPSGFVSLVQGLPVAPLLAFVFAPFAVSVPDGGRDPGRVWLVGEGSRFDDVSAAERGVARAVMRCGLAVWVLGDDLAAVDRVGAALRRLQLLDGDGGWNGHA